MQTATIIGPQCSSGVGVTPNIIGGYSPPSSSTYAVATEVSVANTSTAAITVGVSLYNGSTDYFLAKNAPVAIGDSFYFPRPITLTNGWSVRVLSSAAASADSTMSVVQYT